MNVIETIKKRKSCRTFNREPLKPQHKQKIESFIGENNFLKDFEDIKIKLVEKSDTNKKMKLDYGMLKGHNTYLLAASKPIQESRVHFGYLAENIVLKATELGVASCWVGYFDSLYFDEIIPVNNSEIPSIVILGYPANKRTSLEIFIRYSSKAEQRLDWEQLFFDYQTNAPLKPNFIQKYSESLEMLRLAPSSGNTQPWRVFYDDTTKEFHFFKKPVSKRYEDKGLHDVDMGIAMSHFELTSTQNGLSGVWNKYSLTEITAMDDLQYIITWKCV